MPFASNVAKHEEKKFKRSKVLRDSINEQSTQNDDVIIKETFDALTKLDASKVRHIIKQPKNFEALLYCDRNHIPCFYLLHAIALVFSLAGVNPESVLNDMSDENITILRELMLVAKQRACPDKKVIEQELATRKTQKTSLKSREHFVNNTMITSLSLVLNVVDLWDDASKALNTWLDVINSFERKGEPLSQSANSLKSAKDFTGWLTMEELAVEIGDSTMKLFYQHKNKILKKCAEAKDWFDKAGVSLMFNPEYLPTFKALWVEIVKNAKSGRKPNSKNKKKTTTKSKTATTKTPETYITKQQLMAELRCTSEKTFYSKKCRIAKSHPEIKDWFKACPEKQSFKLFNVAHLDAFKDLWNKYNRSKRQNVKSKHTDVATETVVQPTLVPVVEEVSEKNKSTKTLVDLETLQAYVTWLYNNAAKAESEKAEKNADYKAKLDAVNTATTASQSTELLQQAIAANQAVLDSESAFEKASKEYAKAQKYLETIKKAEIMKKNLVAMMAESSYGNQI